MNTIGQCLLPLCGSAIRYLSQHKIYNVEFNNDYYSIVVYLNKNVEPINEVLASDTCIDHSIDEEHIKYVLICDKEYKQAYKQLCEGNYSSVNKDIVNDVILPTLNKNRSRWESIFNRDIESVKQLIFNTSSVRDEDTLTDLANTLILHNSIELYKPLNTFRT